MIDFSAKLMFLGLLSLPVLTLIYFLFRKSRPLPVSNLIFWRDQVRTPRHGAAIRRLPLPLTYFIEALIVIFLVLAAATPLLPRQNKTPPVTLILDNSFSMQAGGKNSPQTAARKIVNETAGRFSGRRFRVILAGAMTRNIGEFTTLPELKAALSEWTCNDTASSLQQALAMTDRLDRLPGLVMVLTDHQPESAVLPAGVTWYALGRSRPNTAIVNAARSGAAGMDRVMVVAANLASTPVATTLRIASSDHSQPPVEHKLSLEPHQEKKLTVELKNMNGPVELSLDDDALDFDNRIVMLPEFKPRLRVAVTLGDNILREAVIKALESSDRAVILKGSEIDIGPDLIVTDHQPRNSLVSGCRLIFRSAAAGRPLSGPFIVNRNHPLTTGLDLNGVIWGVPLRSELPGEALVMSGETPLLTVLPGNGSGCNIFMNCCPAFSSLTQTPAWPVLFWNLIEWVEQARPGLNHHNFRAGEKISINLPEATTTLTLIADNGCPVEIPIGRGRCELGKLPPGSYTVVAGKLHLRFQVNPLDYRESDLQTCSSATLRGELLPATITFNYFELAWLPLLLALALLVLHQYLTRRMTP